MDEHGRDITAVDQLKRRLGEAEATIELLEAQRGDQGGGPLHFKCVPITAYAEKVSAKRTALAQREEAVHACREALARLAAAEREVGRLRAGESGDPKQEGAALTPDQWIRMWNDLPGPQRIDWVERIVEGLRAASRCREEDHDSAVRVVAEHRGVAVRLARQLLAHADAEPHDYLAWVPADILAETSPSDNGSISFAR